MIDLENARLSLALTTDLTDITLTNSNYKELIQALEEAKEIMFDIEQGKDPSFYIKEWLAKYFQASVG